MGSVGKKRVTGKSAKGRGGQDRIGLFIRDLDREGFLRLVDQPGRVRIRKLVREHFADMPAASAGTKRARKARLVGRRRGGRSGAGAEILHLMGGGIPAPSKGDLPYVSPESVAKLVTAPGMLTSDEMARRLDVSRETINQWQKAGKIIAVSGAKRGLRFPAWQIGSRGKPYAAIEGILLALDGDHWAAWRFLEGFVAELGQAGHEALAAGREQELLEVLTARSHGAFS
jgi:hypothetical protein